MNLARRRFRGGGACNKQKGDGWTEVVVVKIMHAVRKFDRNVFR